MANTEAASHSQSTQTPELQDGANQGAMYQPVHSTSWHLPYCQETRHQDNSFGLWVSLLRPPLLLRKLSQCPQQLGRSGRVDKFNLSIFPPVILFILLDQGYHRHYTEISNCTKNKATKSDQQKQKPKPQNQTLGTLHCLCRCPDTLKNKQRMWKPFVSKNSYEYCPSCQGKLNKVLCYSEYSIAWPPTAFLFTREMLSVRLGG